MRILHTADWHIGRTLSGFDLLPTQQASFAALRQVAHDQNVDAIIIAGDLYDRGLAAENAVNAVNGMMRTLNRDDGFPLLVISGNHDSAPRLATGSEWYSSTGFYLHTRLEEAFTPVTIGDTQFFLLPYFEPAMARNYFDDDQLTNIGTAMVPVIAKWWQPLRRIRSTCWSPTSLLRVAPTRLGNAGECWWTGRCAA